MLVYERELIIYVELRLDWHSLIIWSFAMRVSGRLVIVNLRFWLCDSKSAVEGPCIRHLNELVSKVGFIGLCKCAWQRNLTEELQGLGVDWFWIWQNSPCIDKVSDSEFILTFLLCLFRLHRIQSALFIFSVSDSMCFLSWCEFWVDRDR